MTLLADELSAPASSRPQGESEDWDDEALLLLLLLLLSDAPRAAALWRTLAPPAYRKLLNAVPLDNVREIAAQGTLPPLWFDVPEQRYGLGPRGRIPLRSIRAAVDAVRDAAQERARAAVARVYAGAVPIGEWQTDFIDTLKLLALAIAAAGWGGIARVSGDVMSQLSLGLKFQARRLQRFARQIQRGVVTPDAAGRRAALYPGSVITNVYDDERRRSHVAVAMTEEINILDAYADHCLRVGDLPGCLELTELGWVEIGTLALPGRRACQMMCRCHLEYRRRVNLRTIP